jgi:NADPH:quinone reductase-like Zn-dependent oxidoreductase
VPDGLDPIKAVGLGLNYITAWQIIHRQLRLQPGQSLLVHGAAGGVGTALLEIGNRAELKLYGTASAAKHHRVRERGGEPIDYRNQDFVARLSELAPKGLDAVTDPIGGQHLLRSRRVLRPGGRLVFFGVSGDVGGGTSQVLRGLFALVRLALSPGLRLSTYGFQSSPVSLPGRCRRDWAKLLALGAAGELSPLIGATIPLTEAAQAHDLLDRGAVEGKIVLTTENFGG